MPSPQAALGPWTSQDPGFKFSFTGAIEHLGYLYQFGGTVDNVAVATSDCFVSSARINTDGSLGPATVVGTSPLPMNNSQIMRWDDYIFTMGGNGTGATDAITRFKLQSGGGVGAGVLVGRLPRTVTGTTSGFDIPTQGPYGYLYGPTAGLSVIKFSVSGVDSITDIAIPPVTNFTSCYTLMHGNNILLVGGSISNVNVNTIYACKLTGLSAGPWRIVGQLPVAMRRVAAKVVKGRLVVCGGIDGGLTAAVADVYSAPIDPDGNVGPFATECSLPTASSGMGIAMTHRYLYVLAGGLGTIIGVNTNLVQYAKILR
jgi:hypothetical protein